MKKENIINHGLLMDTVNMGAKINADANNYSFCANKKVINKARRKVTSVRLKSASKRLVKINIPKKHR